MPQVAVLGADFAALKVPARDLGGLTALQELKVKALEEGELETIEQTKFA